MEKDFRWREFFLGVAATLAAAVLGGIANWVYDYALARKDFIADVRLVVWTEPQGGMKEVQLLVIPRRQGIYEFVLWADGNRQEIQKAWTTEEGRTYSIQAAIPANTKTVSVGVRGPFWTEVRSKVTIPLH